MNFVSIVNLVGTAILSVDAAIVAFAVIKLSPNLSKWGFGQVITWFGSTVREKVNERRKSNEEFEFYKFSSEIRLQAIDKEYKSSFSKLAKSGSQSDIRKLYDLKRERETLLKQVSNPYEMRRGFEKYQSLATVESVAYVEKENSYTSPEPVSYASQSDGNYSAPYDGYYGSYSDYQH